MSKRRVWPFYTTFAGVTSVVWAENQGKARMITAHCAHDAGFMKRADPSRVGCRRAHEFDDKKQETPTGCLSVESARALP